MIIEIAKLIYGIAKDVYEYNSYKKDSKLIDNARLEQIKEKLRKDGIYMKFYWSDEEKIEARRQDGWDYYYEIDKENKTQWILRQKNGQILIAKKSKEGEAE